MNYGPGRCKQCGDDSSGWICMGCEAAEHKRGRAWAEGAAEVLRPLIDRLTMSMVGKRGEQ
jgi:hypothetical protein